MGRVRIEALSYRLEDGGRGEDKEARDGGKERGGGRRGRSGTLEGEGLYGLEVGPIGGRLGRQGLGFLIRRTLGPPGSGGTSCFGVFGQSGGSGGDFGLAESEHGALME